MQTLSSRKYQTSLFRRYLCLVLLIVLGYLCEVCVMPYIRFFDVTPNLLFIVIGIITVAYGKLRAFWAGLAFGLLMEIMLPSVTYLNLILYPVSTLFCSFAFADKPIKTIEYEKAMNRQKKELPPWVRTVLCTALNTLIYEAVNVTYIYLGGSALTAGHFLKALADIILTSLFCLILLFPIRRIILGPKMEIRVLKSAPVEFRKK